MARTFAAPVQLQVSSAATPRHAAGALVSIRVAGPAAASGWAGRVARDMFSADV